MTRLSLVCFVLLVAGCRSDDQPVANRDYSEDFTLAFGVAQPKDARDISCTSASQGSNFKSTQLIFQTETEKLLPAIVELYPEVSADEFKKEIVQIPRTVQFEDSDFHSGARYFLRLDDATVKPSRRGFVYVDPSRNQVITSVSVIDKWGPYAGLQEPGVVTTK